MYFLNYIYFIIISFLGLKFLTSKQVILTNPLNKSQKMAMTGPEMFWILTFSTGLLAFSSSGGAINLMAIRLFVLEFFLILGLFIVKTSPYWSPAAIIYVLYIIWLIIGLIYSPAPDYGFRVILKYIYPLLIMLFASAVVRDKEVFIKAGIGARTVAVISIIFAFVPFIGRLVPGVFWYGTAEAINYISICIFSIALCFYTNEKKTNLFYAILFMLPCFIWVLRTSIMGTGIAIMAFAFFKYKFKSLPVIAAVLIIGIISIFTIPSLKEKMFNSDEISLEDFQSGNVSKDDINSNARFAMWEHLENRFYVGNELQGSGTGSVQNYMYSNFVFGGLNVPHSDFVQMKCDNGLVGLILYICIIACTVIHSFQVYSRTTDQVIKVCSIVAGSTMLGVFATLYSDNVVNYSMATLSMPFGFYGMMLGLIKGAKK